MRAPGMAVAHADGEAELAIGIGRGLQVAHGVDDMVEASGHELSICVVAANQSTMARL